MEFRQEVKIELSSLQNITRDSNKVEFFLDENNISSINIDVQQKKRSSKNNKLFKFNFEINPRKKIATYNFKINPGEGSSVEDVLKIYEVYYSFLKKEIKINNVKLSELLPDASNFNELDIKNAELSIDFWRSIKKIEKITKQKFKPSKIVNDMDNEVYSELRRCLIEDNVYKNEIKSLNGLKVSFDHKNEKMLENIKGKSGLMFTLLDEKKIDFCGAKIKVYYANHLSGLKMVDYKTLKKTKDGMDVSLTVEAEDNGNIIMITKLFINKKDAEKFMTKRFDKNELENLSPL